MTTANAPTAVSAVAGAGQATITFTASSNATAAGVTGYTVTATDTTTSGNGGQTTSGASSPITVTGLTNGDNYTFAVVADATGGNSVASTASNSVTPVTVPSAPTSVSAQAGNSSATVTFSAPNTNGGNAITGYTVTATDTSVPANGGQTVSGSSSPLSLAGLTNGDGYTFTVTATNNVGTSVASSASNLVTPAVPATSNTQVAPYSNALSFAVAKAINLDQLNDEMAAALGQSVTLALNGANYIPPPSSISPTNPATLWVMPNTVNETTVQTVINNHVANPNYNLPTQTQEFLAVVAAIQGNSSITLTSAQMNTAIIGLVLQVEALFAGGATP
jgi:Fibronectin type III domain